MNADKENAANRYFESKVQVDKNSIQLLFHFVFLQLCLLYS